MIQQQTVGALKHTDTYTCMHPHTHMHTHTYAQPLSLPFHHFSIFISVIYSKSIAVSHTHTYTQTDTHTNRETTKKHCNFTALGNSCHNISSKDHSKILKMCHHRRSDSASVTICLLLKHYATPPQKKSTDMQPSLLSSTISSLSFRVFSLPDQADLDRHRQTLSCQTKKK